MFAETNPATLFIYVVRYIPDTPPNFCTASDVKLGGILGMRPGEEYSWLLGWPPNPCILLISMSLPNMHYCKMRSLKQWKDPFVSKQGLPVYRYSHVVSPFGWLLSCSLSADTEFQGPQFLASMTILILGGWSLVLVDEHKSPRDDYSCFCVKFEA